METKQVVYIFCTLVLALCVHLVLKILKPKEKIDTTVFEDVLDDQGWAAEDEGKEGAAAVTSSSSSSSRGGIDIDGTSTLTTTTPTAASSSLAAGASTTATPASPTTTKKPFQKRTDDGPYEIGDRVILKGLLSATELNGRHGCVADVWNKKTERYPIALDLTTTTSPASTATANAKPPKPLSVKICNMEREPPIPVEIETRRVDVVNNGCLPEVEGRVFSFIFNSFRGSVSGALKGEKDGAKLAAFGWTFWNHQPGGGGDAKQQEGKGGKGIYPSLKEFLFQMDPAKVEELEKQLNPESPKGSYEKVKQALDSPLAVASWNVRIHGEFWIVAMGPQGTLVVPVHNPNKQVYCVLGIKVPLGAQVMGKMPRPPKFELTLVPWYGRLVHDPLLMTTTGSNQIEVASPQLAKELVDTVQLAAAEGRVVSRLAQLEVPGGSKEGLPYKPNMRGGGGVLMSGSNSSNSSNINRPPGATNQPPPDFSKMEPATQEERILIDNLADFDVFPPGPDGKQTPMGIWNFIRQGETEQDNPKRLAFVLAANGSKITDYATECLAPTPVELLKVMLSVVTKLQKRPAVIGIDDPKCCLRLQFLTQGMKNVRVLQINVTRKKGPAPSTSSGTGTLGTAGPAAAQK
eukprot:CAMPEP_0117080244 /NCGR_PEP_ID=MMETSP0472-20121206/56625_1 /TAXON_ID=693140 ORGANISM="Tiarina fusus, Strain LIS" /NCGR_SAMPLE_ID=MMETSP0472 /ASSEMBLY_ACC=CAM_ASM_000603 /LENGTH=632 /DNA_ID=CAMNT_0004807821 /DNA_START=16 /DNA_END=1914 /DNA_ORIENTATION=+